MDILIVSGFLGAGKTTFIKHLAKNAPQPFAVMENEYGSTGVDGNLLKQNRLKVWELTEGCICCSLKSDFASSILTIANTINPPVLVVEPTGVGLLSSVIHNIQKITYEHIRLLEPVTIVDIHCVDDYLRDFGDFYRDQILHTQKIILSKTEDSSRKEITRITGILRTINPTADIHTEPYSNCPSDWWNNFFSTPYHTEQLVSTLPDQEELELEQTGFSDIAFDTVQELMECLVAAMRSDFGKIYRIKGYCTVNNEWSTFHLVDKQYSITQCETLNESKVIIIGKNLNKEQLHRAFGGTPVNK